MSERTHAGAGALHFRLLLPVLTLGGLVAQLGKPPLQFLQPVLLGEPSEQDFEAKTRLSELQVIGLGPYSSADLTENCYRTYRRMLATKYGSDLPALPGDSDMPIRTSHTVQS